MTKQANPQSLKRSQESVAALFSDTTAKADVLFMKSSTDVGVERNGGRNGARFAPKSFLAYFKKQTKHGAWSSRILAEVEIACESTERTDFAQAQKSEAEKIALELSKLPKTQICHLGGGHDHAYPFMQALTKKYQRIIVINIDAHADTRIDAEPNSGTPFRQFADITTSDFHLFQIGLHPFANSESTLSPLKKGQAYHLWRTEITEDKLSSFFAQIAALITPNTGVFFSLDADALEGSLVPGVSAVNGAGLSLQELEQIWTHYKRLKLTHPTYLGLYELNPVYDTLSMLSMRTFSNFVFHALS